MNKIKIKMSVSGSEILALFSNFAVCLFPSHGEKVTCDGKTHHSKCQIQQYNNKKIKMYNSADSHVGIFDACQLPEALSLFGSTY